MYSSGVCCYGPLAMVSVSLAHRAVDSPEGVKYRRENHRATCTKLINTGTSITGPMTAANAWPEFKPNTPTATAIASSKLLLPAVNESVAVFG